jgi:hypothetical protein
MPYKDTVYHSKFVTASPKNFFNVLTCDTFQNKPFLLQTIIYDLTDSNLGLFMFTTW